MRMSYCIALATVLSITPNLRANKTVTTIGGAQLDVFIQCKTEQPIYGLSGKKLEIFNPSDYTSCGGGAINSAIAFSRLGFRAQPLLKLGQDERSKQFVKKLESEKVSTKNIIFSNDNGTGVSYIIPSPDHDNCVLIYRGANKYIDIKEIPFNDLKTSKILYITSLSGESSEILLPIVESAKINNKINIAVNAGSSQLKNGYNKIKQSLPFIDVLLLNETEAKILMYSILKDDPQLEDFIIRNNSLPKDLSGPILLRNHLNHKELTFTLKQFFNTTLELGPKIVVVTNGADGIYLATKEQIYYHPSIPTQVVSTTGAGDAFGAGFIATLLKENDTITEAIQNKTIEKAICYGVLNSTSVISYMDTNKGLLNLEELNIKSKDKANLLQKFDIKE